MKRIGSFPSPRKTHALVLFLLGGALCSSAAGLADLFRRPEIQPNTVDDSIFGVGYAALQPPGLAAKYKETGIRCAKLANVQWQFIEPSAPKLRHNYRWGLMDRMVREYQNQDFTLQVILRGKSNWASRPVADKRMDIAGGGIATTFPKDEHIEDYKAWIAAVVERYDGDGDQDMFGLRYPILHYEIESEAQHEAAWQGTAEEYLQILRLARDAARGACPDVRILLSGFDFGDLFDDMPSQQTIDQRFEKLRKAGRRDQEFIETTLKATDAYDIIELHYNRDYKGIFRQIEHIRKFSDRPIWAGDAASGPFLLAFSELFFNPLYPEAVAAPLFKKIVAGDQDSVAWFRAEQAKLTTQKFAAGAAVGLKKVIIELTGVWEKTPGMGGFHNNFFIQNMVDRDLSPFPVFHTLKLLVDKIDGFTAVARETLGDPNVYAYRFTVRGKPVFIAWYDDNKNQLPGQPQGQKAIALPVGTASVRVTGIVSQMDQTEPKTEERKTEGGTLRMPLTEMPVIIEPQ